MSRSYRKPYSAITGTASAKDDKVQVARGVRRAQNRALKQVRDWDEFLVPHHFECCWKDVWSWRREGKQRLQFPKPRKTWLWATDHEERVHDCWVKWHRE